MKIARHSLTIAAVAFVTSAFGAAAPDLSKLPPPSTKTGLTYATNIRPILEASCFGCHTDGQRPARGGLNMGTLAGIMNGGDSGAVVVRGKSAESLLVVAASRIDPETAMPPSRRGGPGGGPVTVMPQNLATQILSQADKDADKKISRDELRALADVWFDRMDTNKSGLVDHERLLAGLIAAMPPSAPPPAAPPRGAPPAVGARPGTPARPGQPPPASPAPPPRGQPALPAIPEGPEPVPLTGEQVGLLRAWIDQGAK